jgi:hypothetical protein
MKKKSKTIIFNNNMKTLKKESIKESKNRLDGELITIHTFTCPNCGERFESDEFEEKEEFINSLIKEGVRYVHMKYMQGLFCKSCYEDEEIQNSTL